MRAQQVSHKEMTDVTSSAATQLDANTIIFIRGTQQITTEPGSYVLCSRSVNRNRELGDTSWKHTGQDRLYDFPF